MANYISSIQIHDIGIIREITIFRNVFARIHIRQDLFYIEIFDWKKSTSSSHCKAILFPGVKIVRLYFSSLNFLITHFQDAIRLLPGDRLLAFSEDHVLIYSFVTAGEARIVPPVVVPPGVVPPVVVHILQNHFGSYLSPGREQIAAHCPKGSRMKLPHILLSKRGISMGSSFRTMRMRHLIFIY